MNYPVDTPVQLRAVLRALRHSRSITQEQTGKLLGVNQRRAAKIEGSPGVTSFAQISRLVSALGGRLFIEVRDSSEMAARAKRAKTKKPAHGATGSAAGSAARKPSGNW
jgi:HTH-type transcriptional regulator/antitoxin HipB